MTINSLNIENVTTLYGIRKLGKSAHVYYGDDLIKLTDNISRLKRKLKDNNVKLRAMKIKERPLTVGETYVKLLEDFHVKHSNYGDGPGENIRMIENALYESARLSSEYLDMARSIY